MQIIRNKAVCHPIHTLGINLKLLYDEAETKSMQKLFKTNNSGFTLMELLVVIAIIGIMVTAVLVAINPGRQFAAARDTQRRNDIQQVIKACNAYAASNNGNFPPSLDGVSTPSDIGTSGLNLAADLVPEYLTAIPYDPSTGDDTVTNYELYMDNYQIQSNITLELTP